MRIEAKGVYEIDGQEPLLLVQEDSAGERFAEVSIKLVSNPIEGLPERMNLRFSDYDLARMVANKPNSPFQVTVEYDSPDLRFGPQEPPDNTQIFNRPINGEVRPVSEFFNRESNDVS